MVWCEMLCSRTRCTTGPERPVSSTAWRFPYSNTPTKPGNQISGNQVCLNRQITKLCWTLTLQDQRTYMKMNQWCKFFFFLPYYLCYYSFFSLSFLTYLFYQTCSCTITFTNTSSTDCLWKLSFSGANQR